MCNNEKVAKELRKKVKDMEERTEDFENSVE